MLSFTNNFSRECWRQNTSRKIRVQRSAPTLLKYSKTWQEQNITSAWLKNWFIYGGIIMKLKTLGSRVMNSVGWRLIKWNMIALRFRRWIIHWEIQYKINLKHETRKSRRHCIILKVNHKVLQSSYVRWSEKVIHSHGNSLLISQDCFRSGFPKVLFVGDQLMLVRWAEN